METYDKANLNEKPESSELKKLKIEIAKIIEQEESDGIEAHFSNEIAEDGPGNFDVNYLNEECVELYNLTKMEFDNSNLRNMLSALSTNIEEQIDKSKDDNIKKTLDKFLAYIRNVMQAKLAGK